MAAKTLADWLQDLQSGENQRIKEAVRALSYIGQEAIPPVIALIANSTVSIEHLGRGDQTDWRPGC
jgi:hypothetical protein